MYLIYTSTYICTFQNTASTQTWPHTLQELTAESRFNLSLIKTEFINLTSPPPFSISFILNLHQGLDKLWIRVTHRAVEFIHHSRDWSITLTDIHHLGHSIIISQSTSKATLYIYAWLWSSSSTFSLDYVQYLCYCRLEKVTSSALQAESTVLAFLLD